MQGKRKKITQLNIVKRISPISEALLTEIKVPSPITKSSTKLEFLKNLKIS